MSDLAQVHIFVVFEVDPKFRELGDDAKIAPLDVAKVRLLLDQLCIIHRSLLLHFLEYGFKRRDERLVVRDLLDFPHPDILDWRKIIEDDFQYHSKVLDNDRHYWMPHAQHAGSGDNLKLVADFNRLPNLFVRRYEYCLTQLLHRRLRRHDAQVFRRLVRIGRHTDKEFEDANEQCQIQLDMLLPDVSLLARRRLADWDSLDCDAQFIDQLV